MNIVIFGSGGFIGRHLQESIARTCRYNVYAPKRSDLDLADSVRVSEWMTRLNVDLVINCAVKVGDLSQSIISSLNIIRSMPRGCVYFQVGSGAEYGRYDCPPNVTEFHFGSNIPSDTYGIHKYLIARILDSHLEGGFLNLRAFGIFGYGEEERRLIPSLVRSAIKLNRAAISRDGLFSYVSINDLCNFVTSWLAQGCQTRGHYNFCGPNPIMLSKILEIISEEFPNATCTIDDCTSLSNPYFGSTVALLEAAPWFEYRELIGEIRAYIGDLRSSIQSV